MFLKHTVSKPTVKIDILTAKWRMYHFKAQNFNKKLMFFGCFFRYWLQIWHGYTVESALNSHVQQLSLCVLDAMLGLFKHIVELCTYASISLSIVYLCRLSRYYYCLLLGVNVCGQVVVTALYPFWKLFIMTNGASVTSFTHIAPSWW